MKDVEIYECDLIDKDKKKKGKLAILRGGLKSTNPIAHMNNAVSTYVGREPYSEYVDINMDNPWIRVIISGINELEFKKFNNHSLK
jgi:hypothetical protein